MSLGRVIASTFVVQVKLGVVNPLSYLNAVVYPLLLTSFGITLLGSSGAPGRIAYAIVGGGLVAVWSATYVDGGRSINAERGTGTLELLLGAPTPLLAVLTGKLGWSLALGSASFLPAFVLALAWFHRAFQPLALGPFAISLAVTFFSFFTLGLALAPLFTLARWAFSLVSGIEALVYLLGGFMFPVAQLPAWLRIPSALLAPSWSVRALYAAIERPPGLNPMSWWLAALGLSAVYLAICVCLLQWFARRARSSGELAMA